MERFVRIEAFQQQEPVVGVLVGFQELEAAGETARQAEVRLVVHVLAVDCALQPLLAGLEVVVLRGELLAHALQRRLHHRLPRIVFLAADEVPGLEARVVGGAAILEVVQVVGDQVGIDAVLAHQLGKRVVERLQRPPAAVHEVQPAGVQVTARRHARKAADPVVLESDAPLGETVEIRRGDRAMTFSALWKRYFQRHSLPPSFLTSRYSPSASVKRFRALSGGQVAFLH